MPSVELGSFTASLAILYEKGVRYSTVIDLGCADGHFFLQHADMGFFRDAVCVNIDANPIYEESLRRIQAVMGGHWLITAVGDREGEIEIFESGHPYWNSTRAPDDAYWDRVAHKPSGTRTAPLTSLDAIGRRLALQPPYLIKLDIQGGEVAALRGAAAILEQTDVVICEADLDDFQAINAELVGRGFDIFDLTGMNRIVADHSLGWFYPVYTHRRLDRLRERHLWRPVDTASLAKAQDQRRAAIIAETERVLARQPRK